MHHYQMLRRDILCRCQYNSVIYSIRAVTTLQACNDKVDKIMNKMKSLQDDCHNIYPYDLRAGPLPEDKTMVIQLCDCPQVCVAVRGGGWGLFIRHVCKIHAPLLPQLRLEVGKEYKILGDVTGKTKWKVSKDVMTNG